MRRAAFVFVFATGCSFEPVLPYELEEAEADGPPDQLVEVEPTSRDPMTPNVPSGPARSCRELYERDRSLSDGYYRIGERQVRVWCDMTIDGGGWTLAGRSSSSAFSYELFGWRIGNGTVDDDSRPYSLDVLEVGVPFTEVLVGTRGPGKTWGPIAIALSAGENFLSRCAEERCEVSPRAVIGDCVLESTRYAGVAEHALAFVLDDRDQGEPHSGLYARGFSVASRGCSNVDGAQGMIFVR